MAAPGQSAWNRTVRRLPRTVRPSVYQQMAEWDSLFPFEQRGLRRFFCGIDSYSNAELDALTAPLRGIETKMGVAEWNFSESSNTLENSGELARSAYFAEWRDAVQQLFDAIDSRPCPELAEPEGGRAIVAVLPASLPADPQILWSGWAGGGRVLEIQGDARDFCRLLLRMRPGIGELATPHGEERAAAWWIDAADLSEGTGSPGTLPGVSCLSYTRLNPLRQEFLAELNRIPRDTHVASETLLELRRRNWSQWWPAELAGEDRLRDFVINLYLTGNGALIFSNAFVEWAASEVLRRARPRLLVTRFGVRARPRLFTGIAVFENQEKVSPLPDVPDPVGSAADAAILARYAWLSALRYPQYQRALCVCVSERLNAAWVAAPGSAPGLEHDSVTPQDLCKAVVRTLTA